MKRKRQKVRDPCVVCGGDTGYTRDTPVEQRLCYIEGGGQLCRRCFAEIYDRRFFCGPPRS